MWTMLKGWMWSWQVFSVTPVYGLVEVLNAKHAIKSRWKWACSIMPLGTNLYATQVREKGKVGQAHSRSGLKCDCLSLAANTAHTVSV